MKVIVVAVDVGKWPALLHYSFLTQRNKFTEMFSRWPDHTNFWEIIWINSPLHSRSPRLPFPSLFSLHFQSTSLSTHAQLNLPSLVFIRRSSCSDLCIPAQVVTSSALIGASSFFFWDRRFWHAGWDAGLTLLIYPPSVLQSFC